MSPIRKIQKTSNRIPINKFFFESVKRVESCQFQDNFSYTGRKTTLLRPLLARSSYLLFMSRCNYILEIHNILLILDPFFWIAEILIYDATHCPRYISKLTEIIYLEKWTCDVDNAIITIVKIEMKINVSNWNYRIRIVYRTLNINEKPINFEIDLKWR